MKTLRFMALCLLTAFSSRSAQAITPEEQKGYQQKLED
jgi:hypothetical protein